ncbi:hypothetical protein CKALI_03550 [Corynebacterium kalinowskii]|uniref:Uncharacterized protein n=1 Tax=Corynebacterium kalinowskii TaxID=2675216 RepID=A0A6B8VBQ1_9CORY|nr:hypothetical protein [Corynebacterium kalinowskii]QGU01593.1 hypothetical protein CKALI_03550 [Corynebacterium kalinowskii]
MHVVDAKLRHRELTQEVYDIGDEVVEYIEHLMEAIADWDVELVEDCFAEFTEIVEDARNDSRRVVAELAGLRQALTSGLRSGTVSVRAKRESDAQAPEALSVSELIAAFPLEAPALIRDMTTAMNARSQAVLARLEQVNEWILNQTAVVADDLDSLSLPVVFSRTQRIVDTTIEAWQDAVAAQHPEYTRTMWGSNPPKFLLERARIDAIVAKVAAKRAKGRAS